MRDCLLAGVVAVAWWAATTVLVRLEWSLVAGKAFVLAGAATSAAVLLQRRWPFTALVAATVVYPGIFALGQLDVFGDGASSGNYLYLVPLLLAGYRTALTRRVHSWTVLALALSGALALLVPWQAQRWSRIQGPPLSSLLIEDDPIGWLVYWYDVSGTALLLVLVAASVLLGKAVGRARRAAEALRSQNAELTRLRAVEVQQSLAAERTRIARDLHDVAAHHLSAVVLRAQAADRVATSRPEELAEAVRWIARTSAESLHAVRQVVGVLRASPPPAPAAVPRTSGYRPPEPHLADLHAIAGRLTEAGMAVSVHLPDDPAPLPPPLEATVVRIVQEALTNAMVHGPARHAVVLVRRAPGHLEVRIDDDGVGAHPPAVGHPDRHDGPGVGGHGLRGMHERAALCGGRLWAGPHLGARGWAVVARLPVPSAAAPVELHTAGAL